MAALPSGPPMAWLPGMPAGPAFDAVILAGGRGRRLGGEGKPGLVIGSSTMAAAVASAVASAGVRRIVLVGPARPELAGLATTLPGGLAVTREDPPGSGPVPALRAGLAEVGASWVVLLAADLPFLRAADVRELVLTAVLGGPPGPVTRPGGPGGLPADDLAPGQRAGAVLADDEGAAQWLAGCWPAGPLRAALAGYAGDSLRGVLGPLAPVLLHLAGDDGAPPPWQDCDTPAALEAARIAAQGAGGRAGIRDRAARKAPAAAPAAGRDCDPRGGPVTNVERWIQAACAELGLDPAAVPVRTVLDLARDAAHQVERPAAPLTAFLLGLAAAGGQDPEDAAARLSELAASWTPPESPRPGS
jgi:hypothetical protein